MKRKKENIHGQNDLIGSHLVERKYVWTKKIEK